MFLVLAALAVLALTTGFLVGQAGSTATVLAAVMPIIIAGGGAAALGLSFSGGGDSGQIRRLPATMRPAAALGVIIFSTTLLAGNYAGTSYKVWTQNEARATAIRLHLDRLKECILDEYTINTARRDISLPPLPPQAFCPTTVPQ